MDARKIELQLLPENDRWRAIGVVNGSIYSVEGNAADAVFDEFCGMLRRPFDRWRVIELAPGRIVCEELLRNDAIIDRPDTVEIPVDAWWPRQCSGVHDLGLNDRCARMP